MSSAVPSWRAIPVSELADQTERFLAHLATLGRSPHTVRIRRIWTGDAVCFLAARGCLRAADLTPADLDAYLLHVRARGCATATIGLALQSVRVWCAWLTRSGLLLSDPARTVLTIDGEDPLPEPPLSEAQVAALLAAVPGHQVIDLRNRAHLEVLYGCGLRLGESLDARVAHLDRGERTLLVHGKGGHERLLPILPSAWVALDAYLAVRRTLLRGPDTAGYLFLSGTGGRLDDSTFRTWIRRLGHRVLGEDVRVHPHALRHALAVHLMRGGADIRHVQEALGHADLETTKTYLRLVPGHLRVDYDRAMPELA